MNKVSGAVHVCTKQFNARLGDELNLKVGDKIEVLADDSEYNDGWYMGRNVLSEAVGLFPKSFTKVFEQPQTGTLLRLRSRRLPLPLSKDKGEEKAEEKPKDDLDVNSTMKEIDKALHELQVSSQTPKGHLRNPSTQSLTQDLNPLKAAEWTPKQVSLYFAIVLGFDMDVAGKFARHKITGAILFQLDLAHLKELDIDSFGTRFEVHREIEKLRAISDRAQNPEEKRKEPQPKDQKAEYETFREPQREKSREEEESILDKSLGNSRFVPQHSQSQHNLLPAASVDPGRALSRVYGHQRKRSQLMENVLSTPKPVESAFHLPRRPPQPPSALEKTAKSASKAEKYSGKDISDIQEPYMTRTTASRPALSVYEASVHTPNHRRHSLMFSFMLGQDDKKSPGTPKAFSRQKQPEDLTLLDSHEPGQESVDIDDVGISPSKARASKAPGRLKTLRLVSTQNFRNLTGSKKLKTLAFQEGIREISPDEAIKTSSYSGWMAKKSGSTLGWRLRYFTLHGTRLSYFASLRDRKEKGLIDITAHKVIPISTEGEAGSNDKYVALYAASTGFGRYCFKLVPPAPGFRKGLTFTQPKTHFFAVESPEEMRAWLKALMTATIDIDDTLPVVSSCSTPTVSLAKAQELLAKAREETKVRDEELRAKGIIQDDDMASSTLVYNDSATSDELPVVASLDESTLSLSGHPKLAIDTQLKSSRVPTTPQILNHSGGFASPYLLASGLLSPKQPSPSTASSPDYFGEHKPKTERVVSERAPEKKGKLEVFANSTGRIVSGSRKKLGLDKLMAYTSDGSFVIKTKKG